MMSNVLKTRYESRINWTASDCTELMTPGNQGAVQEQSNGDSVSGRCSTARWDVEEGRRGEVWGFRCASWPFEFLDNTGL